MGKNFFSTPFSVACTRFGSEQNLNEKSGNEIGRYIYKCILGQRGYWNCLCGFVGTLPLLNIRSLFVGGILYEKQCKVILSWFYISTYRSNFYLCQLTGLCVVCKTNLYM